MKYKYYSLGGLRIIDIDFLGAMALYISEDL